MFIPHHAKHGSELWAWIGEYVALTDQLRLSAELIAFYVQDLSTTNNTYATMKKET